MRALEEARIAKQIGSSLEARVEISAAGATYDLLERYRDELRYLFIVSQVDVLGLKKARAGWRLRFCRPKVKNANAAGTIQLASANRRAIRLFASVAWLRWKRLNRDAERVALCSECAVYFADLTML